MSPDAPQVSVVVTTFNRLAWLRRALLSVEAQTFGDIELIVLDDGSSDGTPEFLTNYRTRFPFSWQSFENRERSYLRNEGTRRASAPLVAFLDDDDEWLPEKLAKQVAASSAVPEAGMIYCFSTPIDSSGSTRDALAKQHAREYRDQASRGHDFESLARSCLFFTSTIVVKRDVLLGMGGYSEELVGAEDWDLYLRLARDSSIHVVPEELVLYRVHDSNSAADDGLGLGKVGAARIRAAERFLAGFRESGGDAGREALMLRAIALNHYWASRPRDALRYGIAALRSSPRAILSRGDAAWLAKAAWKSLATRGA